MWCQLAHNNFCPVLSFTFHVVSFWHFSVSKSFFDSFFFRLNSFDLFGLFHVLFHLWLPLFCLSLSTLLCTLLPPSLHRCLWTTSITTMTSHQGASYDFVLITCCLIFKATHFHRDGHYIYVIRGWLCCCCCWQLWGSQISISPAAIMMRHLCDTTILQAHSSQSNRPCAPTNDKLSPQTCQEVETLTHMQVQTQCTYTYQISECRSIVHHYCCDESQHKVSDTDLSPPTVMKPNKAS